MNWKNVLYGIIGAVVGLVGPIAYAWYSNPAPRRHWFYQEEVTMTVTKSPWWTDAADVYMVLFLILIAVVIAGMLMDYSGRST